MGKGDEVDKFVENVFFLYFNIFISFLHCLNSAQSPFTVADPDLELRRGPSFNLLALLAFISCHFDFFLLKIRGKGVAPWAHVYKLSSIRVLF